MNIDPYEPLTVDAAEVAEVTGDAGLAYEALLEAVREHRWAVGAAYRIGSVGAAHSADVALWRAAGLGAYADPAPAPVAADPAPVADDGGLVRPAMMEDVE